MADPSRIPRVYLVGAAVAAVLAFFVARSLLGPGANAVERPPDEIIGTWFTTEPRYADRSFTILDDEFQLQVGADSVLAYRIREIRRFEREDHVAIQVTYNTREGETLQEFQLLPDGSVRLKNPADVKWERR